MANRTDPLARSIHGTNPQNLVEQILRAKIYQSRYWKEDCFGLSAESLVDKAVELNHVGGTYGGQRKPTDFICLVAKMLQIQPDKEIIVEFIKNEEYKYVRLLGAFYLRLVGKAVEVYQYLEPLYNDYRKVRKQLADGNYTLGHVDDIIDEMLQSDYMFDIALPRLQSRLALQQTGALEARVSVLAEDFDEAALEAEAGEAAVKLAALEAKIGNDVDRDQGRQVEKGHDRDWDRAEKEHEQARGRERDLERDRERQRQRDKFHTRDRQRVRERERRDRSRERESDRYRRGRARKSRSRSRSRDRHRGHERQRDHRDKASARDRSEKRQRRSPAEERTRRRKKKHTDISSEIAEQNAVRAKLGMKPLH